MKHPDQEALLLRFCELEDTVNFKAGIENALGCRLVQSARNQRDKVFDVHVVSDGDASRTHVLECTPSKIGGGPRLSGGRGCGRGSCTSRRIRTCGGRAASKRGKTPKSANNI